MVESLLKSLLVVVPVSLPRKRYTTSLLLVLFGFLLIRVCSGFFSWLCRADSFLKDDGSLCFKAVG